MSGGLVSGGLGDWCLGDWGTGVWGTGVWGTGGLVSGGLGDWGTGVWGIGGLGDWCLGDWGDWGDWGGLVSGGLRTGEGALSMGGYCVISVWRGRGVCRYWGACCTDRYLIVEFIVMIGELSLD